MSDDSVRPVVKTDDRLAMPSTTVKPVTVAKVPVLPAASAAKCDLHKQCDLPVVKVIAQPKAVTADKAPAVKSNSKKMVRVRSVFENVNGTITWNSLDKTVQAISQEKDVNLKLKIGSTKAVLNSKEVTMTKPASIRRGRTVVPEMFVSDTLGMDVSK